MKPRRLPPYRILAGACVLVLAGLSQAAAQFPTPGQTNPGGAFPPPPGASAQPRQDPAFPPPPGQAAPQRQDSAFPPAPGRVSAPSGFPPAAGGGFAAPGGGFAAPGGAGGFGSGGGSGPGPSEAQKVCLTFPILREDMEKTGAQIKAAGDRKATREEVCPLFKTIVAKEEKMIKFLEHNKSTCGVPAQAITQLRQNHVNTVKIRNVVCSAGPSGPGPGAAPTLSDALGGPIIADDQSAKQPGRGTFDTLTGNALQR